MSDFSYDLVNQHIFAALDFLTNLALFDNIKKTTILILISMIYIRWLSIEIYS